MEPRVPADHKFRFVAQVTLDFMNEEYQDMVVNVLQHDEHVAVLRMVRDMSVVRYLQNKYGGPAVVPDTTLTLAFVKRVSAKVDLKGIGMGLFCEVVDTIKERTGVGFTHLYLEATSNQVQQLVAFYETFGFVSLDPSNPKYMLAPIGTVRQRCHAQSHAWMQVLHHTPGLTLSTRSILEAMDLPVYKPPVHKLHPYLRKRPPTHKLHPYLRKSFYGPDGKLLPSVYAKR